MNYTLCSAEYCTFREALLGDQSSPQAFFSSIAPAIVPLAKRLNIGFIGCGLMAPSSPLSPGGENGSITLYHDKDLLPEVPTKSDVVQVLSTGEKGFFTFMAHPVKDHTFTEEENLAIKLISMDCFVLGGRARLIGMVKNASITDLMTGVLNQPGLLQAAGMLTAQNRLSQFAGIFINLKNFKYINKSMSSQVGDAAIKIFANTAKAFLKDGEIFARLGGDNFFAVVLKDNLDAFIAKFGNLPVSLDAGPKPVTFKVQARMGIYSINQGDTVSEMMQHSSIALNIAKNVRDEDVVRFNKDMLIKAMHQREVSAEFHKALQNREFIVHYQPKVNLQKKELCGAEALVRWVRHETIVPPMDFVPILEKEGSICALDLFVFETVCKDIKQWIEQGIEPVRVSVNFSKVHLRDEHLADKILGIMKNYGVKSNFIEVELTEVSDYEDAEAMRSFVNVMRQNGIAVSIDDFGTGYSTLNVLKNFDVNVIKLDKSLLDNIGNKESMDEVVVRNVVNLAKEMHKEVIAEGVENEIQAQFLSDIDCHSVQGFLFDKPLKHDEFESRLTGKVAY